jgi:hypothetical protein
MWTASGAVPFQMYEPVRLTIQERDCVMEVQEIQDDSPILVGRLPLLALDWVIDPTGQRLIGNPEHGGDRIVETYRRCAVLPSREFLSRTSSRALVTAIAERSDRHLALDALAQSSYSIASLVNDVKRRAEERRTARVRHAMCAECVA